MKKTKLFLLCLFSLFLFNLTIINATEANLENNDIVEKTTFTLTYNARGGKTTLTKVTVEENEIITVSSKTPAKTGYKFLGWDTQSTGKNVVYKKGDQITMTENITLYAVYGKKVKVTLDLNGGKSSKKYVYVYTNDTYSNLPKPTRTGYIFKGWYTSESNGTLVDSTIKVTKSKNHYIYALWTPKTYTITYNLNGGTNSSKNKETYTIKSSTFKLYSPTKTGYTFKGWYTSSKYKTKVSQIKKGTYGNKTLYAKWQVNKYNIYYNGNGATSGSTKKQTGLLYTKSYNLRSNGYVKKGYKFIGWNTKKDGSGTSYSNKDIVKGLSTRSGGSVYLYAQWEIVDYKITYNLNGGTLSNTNPETYNILTNTFYLNNPTKENYTFLGWYTSSSYKTKITKVKTGSYGNKTLYAKWKPNKFIVDNLDVDIKYGEQIKLMIEYNGSNGTFWCKTSDVNVATCKWGEKVDGKWELFITAKKSGTATIKLYEKDNNEGIEYIDVNVLPAWNDVIIMAQDEIEAESYPLNTAKVVKYNFAEYSSNYYKLYLDIQLVSLGEKYWDNWSQYIYFYDKDGNVIDDSFVVIWDIEANKIYKEDVIVPINTATIVIGNYQYIGESDDDNETETSDPLKWTYSEAVSLESNLNKAMDALDDAYEYYRKTEEYGYVILVSSYNMWEVSLSYLNNAKKLAEENYALTNSSGNTLLSYIEKEISNVENLLTYRDKIVDWDTYNQYDLELSENITIGLDTLYAYSITTNLLKAFVE